MAKVMTVGELKAALMGLDEGFEVHLSLPEKDSCTCYTGQCGPGTMGEHGFMYVAGAHFCPKSSLGAACLMLEGGKVYDP